MNMCSRYCSALKNKIPEFALVRDLKIHPKKHDLIVATHGRGIFIVDDISAMRNLTAEIWDKDVYLFPTPNPAPAPEEATLFEGQPIFISTPSKPNAQIILAA